MWRSVCVRRAVAAAAVFCVSVAFASYSLANNQSGLHIPSSDWRERIVYSLIIDRFEDGGNASDPYRLDDILISPLERSLSDAA